MTLEDYHRFEEEFDSIIEQLAKWNNGDVYDHRMFLVEVHDVVADLSWKRSIRYIVRMKIELTIKAFLVDKILFNHKESSLCDN